MSQERYLIDDADSLLTIYHFKFFNSAISKHYNFTYKIC
jgi:hypothetical protein